MKPNYKAARNKAEGSVPPPVPPEDIPLQDRGSPERELPNDEAAPGITSEKWSMMNRAQRRAARREAR